MEEGILLDWGMMNVTPFIGLLGAIVMWSGFIISLLMFKSFIAQGAAWALSEWLLKLSDKESQRRCCRWLGDSERILQCLEEIKNKVES